MPRSAWMALAVTILAPWSAFGCASEESQPSPYGAIPEPLAAIEGTAEDAYDRALLADAASVAADARAIEEAWKGFRGQALKDGARETDAAALDAAVAGLLAAAAANATDSVALARVANSVSAPMAELFSVYNPKIPASVLELDYLGREVALDGLAGVPEEAIGDVDLVEARWSSLRPRLVGLGGDPEATAFDASIAAERAAIDAADAGALVQAANLQLETVDAVEKIFDAQKAEDPDD